MIKLKMIQNLEQMLLKNNLVQQTFLVVRKRKEKQKKQEKQEKQEKIKN